MFWCTSDIGWIVGHSYIVYAPLCAGVTTLFREGAIDYPDPSIAWQIVEKYGVTKMFTAPTALRMFMRYGEELPQKHDLTHAAGDRLRRRAAESRSLALGADLSCRRRQVGIRGGQLVADRTWRTGAGYAATMPMRPGKAGLALPGWGADVVDIDGKPVAPGVSGRLILKRPFPHDDAHHLGQSGALRKGLAGNPELPTSPAILRLRMQTATSA